MRPRSYTGAPTHSLIHHAHPTRASSSLKHYFLLDQSDFLTHFLDVAGLELSNPARQVSVDKVEALLELVLRNPSSVSCHDPYKEDVGCQLAPMALIDQLLKIVAVHGMDLMGMPDHLRKEAAIPAPDRGPLNGGCHPPSSLYHFSCACSPTHARSHPHPHPHPHLHTHQTTPQASKPSCSTTRCSSRCPW